MGIPVEDRFWSKVQIRGAAECWEWQAAKDGHGYGAIAATNERRTLQAHRVAYELEKGPIPVGMKALHRCDNPGCVNPGHLFLGTHQANMADMCAKGRRVNGKLTAADVQLIRGAPQTARALAARFGVTPSAIRQIKRNVVWAQCGRR